MGLLKKIESLLPEALIADRYAVGHEIMRLKRRKGKTPSHDIVNRRLIRIEKRLQRSVNKRAWRKSHRPQPLYNDALPILSKKATSSMPSRPIRW